MSSVTSKLAVIGPPAHLVQLSAVIHTMPCVSDRGRVCQEPTVKSFKHILITSVPFLLSSRHEVQGYKGCLQFAQLVVVEYRNVAKYGF